MPETLLAWHRKLIAHKYDGTARTADEIEALVVRMAEENQEWGYRRIEGALSNLGHEPARSTIAAILERHGMEPAAERRRKTTWKEFLSRHWEMIVAADFFTVEVWTRRGLQRFMVLFFIDFVYTEGGSCRDRTGGERIVDEPDCPESHRRTGQNPERKAIPDSRPLPLFTAEFLRESLRTAIQNFVAHYHSERNHQGLRNQLISTEVGHLGSAGAIQRRLRLGGMLNYYYWAAA
jgi:putative transposase